MRTTCLVLSASVGTLVTLGVSTGTAWADPVPADPGTAPTTFTVTNGGEPTPNPSHHGSSGTHGTAAGGDATTGTRTDGSVVVVEENQPVGVPWGWITTGVLVVFGGGAGSAYLLSRRGTHIEENDSVSTPNEHLHV